MQKIMSLARWVFALVVGVSVFVFISQNIAAIEVRFFTFSFETSRAALIGASVAIGFILGWLFGLKPRRR